MRYKIIGFLIIVFALGATIYQDHQQTEQGNTILKNFSIQQQDIKQDKMGANNGMQADGTFDILGNGTSTVRYGMEMALFGGDLAIGGTATTTVRGDSATSTFSNGITLSGGCFKDATGSCITAAGASGATVALDNLSGVAINTSLLSDANNTDDLGAYDKAWKDVYASGTIYADNIVFDTGGVPLDDITNPAGDTSIDLGNGKTVTFISNDTTPSPGEGIYNFKASGAFSDDLVFISQAGGNPTAGSKLLALEVDDPDIVPLYVAGNNLESIFYNTDVRIGNDSVTTTLKAGATSTLEYGVSFATTGGNVGIGTADTQDMLTVKPNAANTGISILESDSSDMSLDMIGGSSSGRLRIYRNGTLQHRVAGLAGIVFNEQGQADTDFRVESDTNKHMLFVDSGLEKIGINTQLPSHMLTIFNGDLAVGDGSSTTTVSSEAVTSTSLVATSVLDMPSSSDPTVDLEGETAINTSTSSIRYYDTAERALFPFGNGGLQYSSSTLDYIGDYGAAATTTIKVITPYTPLKLEAFHCITDIGTAVVNFTDGTNDADALNCNSTGVWDYSLSNNTWNMSETISIEIGTQSGDPNVITVSPVFEQQAD